MSGAPLLDCCAYSFREGVPLAAETTDEHRDFGNAVDAHARWVVNGRQGDAPTPVEKVDPSDYLLTCRVLEEWLVGFGLEGMRAQVAFAWDVSTDTARELPTAGDRDYSGAQTGEVPGTTDIVRLVGDELVVIDVKTGFTDIEQYDWQLDSLTLAAARTYDKSAARAITLKVGPTKAYARDRMLDVFTLGDIASRLRANIESIPTAEPRAGAHCTARWCKAVAACPETQKAVELIPLAALVKSDRAFPMTVKIESPEHALWLRDRVKMVAEAADEILAAVKDYARSSGGLPAPGGKVWIEVPSTRSSIDGKAALALAEKMGAPQEDLAACMKSAVVKSFREIKAKGAAA